MEDPAASKTSDTETAKKEPPIRVKPIIKSTTDLTKLYYPGARVVRGPDWKWGDQDEGASKQGTVIGFVEQSEGWVEVEWDNGLKYSYRIGAENSHDIKLAEEIPGNKRRSNSSYSSTKESNFTAEQQLKEFLKKDVTKLKKWPIPEDLTKTLFTSPLPSILQCEICLDVLYNPVQTICCGQSYCKDCIDQLQDKVCPHCRAKLELFPDKKSGRLINDLEIKCPYHIGKRCRWKGCPSELKKHLRDCDIKPITCILGCGKLYERRNMEAHTFFCSNRKVSCQYCMEEIALKDKSNHYDICLKVLLWCPNECSSEKIAREKMNEHIEVCPEHEVSCKYAEFGCDVKVKRKDYDEHLSSAVKQHLSLVEAKVTTSENK